MDYPEFKPFTEAIVSVIVHLIKLFAKKITSEMQYKEKYLLEKIIYQLESLV